MNQWADLLSTVSGLFYFSGRSALVGYRKMNNELLNREKLKIEFKTCRQFRNMAYYSVVSRRYMVIKSLLTPQSH